MAVCIAIKIVGNAGVRIGAESGVELPESSCSFTAELRMEGDADETGLIRKHGVIEADVLVAKVQEEGGNSSAVVGEV